MTEISPLYPDATSLPGMINDARQVVGASCDHEFNCRAFLWERSVMTDLNELIPADSPLHLVFASWINDAGEIVGQAVDKKSGELRAFLASPVAAGKKVADQGATSKAISPEIRNLLQRRLQDGQLAIPQMPYPIRRRR